MEKSKYEELSDRTLFHLIKEVSKQIVLDSIENCIDYSYKSSLDDAGSLMGISPDTYADDDYILNVWRMNEELFDNTKLESKLRRPTLKEYEYEWSVTSRQIVEELWRDRTSLYSEDDGEVRDVLWGMRSEGYLDIFSGKLIKEEVTHSEMEDDELENVKRVK